MLRNITMKDWGMEIEMVNTSLYCWKILICVHRRWSSNGLFHYHRIKDETFYVVKGQLELDIEGENNILFPKETIRVKPFHPHRFRSVANSCVFYEISTQHQDSDSIRIPYAIIN